MKILHQISSLDVGAGEEEAEGGDEAEPKTSMVLGASGGVGIEEWRVMHRGRWRWKMIGEG